MKLKKKTTILLYWKLDNKICFLSKIYETDIFEENNFFWALNFSQGPWFQLLC